MAIATAAIFAVWLLGSLTVSRRLDAQTRIAPAQIKEPRFMALACIAPGSANTNCAGLVYVIAVTPAGTPITLIGAPPPDGFTLDLKAWQPIP